MNTTHGKTTTWPKLEIIGNNGRREKIVELVEAKALGLCEQVIDWLHTGAIQGTTLPGGREIFRYTEKDAAKDAGPALLTAMGDILWRAENVTDEDKEASLSFIRLQARSAIAVAGGDPAGSRPAANVPDEYLHRSLKEQTESGVALANLVRELVARGAIKMGEWDEDAAKLLFDFDKANDRARSALAMTGAVR